MPHPDAAAWRRVLSAIATSESMEHHVLQPLLLSYSSHHEAARVLTQHSADEQRHAGLLTGYLRESLSFTKMKPTKSDQIFYHVLLPSIRFLVKKRPLLGFSLLYFYELFSVQLYAQLRKKAEKQKLVELESLFRQIEKDEFRHIESMKTFIQQYSTDRIHRVWLSAFLWLFRLDIHMGKYALYNRSLRKQFRRLGIDPDTVINKSSWRALTQCRDLLRRPMQ